MHLVEEAVSCGVVEVLVIANTVRANVDDASPFVTY